MALGGRLPLQLLRNPLVRQVNRPGVGQEGINAPRPLQSHDVEVIDYHSRQHLSGGFQRAKALAPGHGCLLHQGASPEGPPVKNLNQEHCM